MIHESVLENIRQLAKYVNLAEMIPIILACIGSVMLLMLFIIKVFTYRKKVI